MKDTGIPHTFRIPYGEGRIAATLPGERLLGVFPSSTAPPLAHLEECLREALLHPTGTPPLRELARGARSVLILCDDLTRDTPADRILPPLLRELAQGGVYEEAVTILFATGSHRALSPREVTAKVGERVARSVASVSHDPGGNLVSVGVTSAGTALRVNPLVKAADLVLAVGSILPHRYCGWSGGGKIVLPGVSSLEAIAAMHLRVTRDSSIRLGAPDNAARREMDEAARLAGLQFLVNVLVNADGAVADLVAGDPVHAHRLGVEKALRLFGTSVPEADIVIAGAHPEDRDLWQAGKALYAAELPLRPDGEIILVASMDEGTGEHREFAELLGFSTEDILRRLEKSETNNLLAGAAAFAQALVLEKARVSVVTRGLPAETARRASLTPYATLQEALDAALVRHPSGSVLVLPDAPKSLPLPRRTSADAPRKDG